MMLAFSRQCHAVASTPDDVAFLYVRRHGPPLFEHVHRMLALRVSISWSPLLASKGRRTLSHQNSSGDSLAATSKGPCRPRARQCRGLGRLLCFFRDWKRKEAGFTTGKKNHHIVIRCATLSWFWDYGNFSSGNQEKNQNITTWIWTPRHDEECSTPCRANKRNAAPLAELRRYGRWSSKALSLSQRALALKEHELLAAVVVNSAQKHVVIVSSDSSLRGQKNVQAV